MSNDVWFELGIFIEINAADMDSPNPSDFKDADGNGSIHIRRERIEEMASLEPDTIYDLAGSKLGSYFGYSEEIVGLETETLSGDEHVRIDLNMNSDEAIEMSYQDVNFKDTIEKLENIFGSNVIVHYGIVTNMNY